ncbi:hypothetical protein LCGC14_2374280 [marine sediment metagenome]|uniref:Disease resistance R13L4/SHOC-2-like LRR domain-containing protein n=1 Tax=marine sediment metagenome TaxID=412755 RepID=A0A0F9EXG4_9ZZZZ
MKELTNREIQWLEALAKKHEFFASFLLHYKLKAHLSNNQYYWLHLYINQAEEQGDTLLNTSEIEFLEEFSKGNENLLALFSIHENEGYLEKGKYKEFLSLKAGLLGVPKEVKALKIPFNHKIVKIPCPFCSILCSPRMLTCPKCGEPLPKLERKCETSGPSDIINEDYAEKNIIHSLEKLIDKKIPLLEKFSKSSTCYKKDGGEITGLSIFKCGIKAFPHEILRLKFLKRLALRRNRIEHLPKEIGFLSNLEYLDLRLNNLETLPNAIGLLFKLENLNVSSNNLMTLPDSIGEMLMLKNLNLSNNKLRCIPSAMENLHSLKSLNLKANHWMTIPENIKKLELEGLDIIL